MTNTMRIKLNDGKLQVTEFFNTVARGGLDRTLCAAPSWSLQTHFCSQSQLAGLLHFKPQSINVLGIYGIHVSLNDTFLFSG